MRSHSVKVKPVFLLRPMTLGINVVKYFPFFMINHSNEISEIPLLVVVRHEQLFQAMEFDIFAKSS